MWHGIVTVAAGLCLVLVLAVPEVPTAWRAPLQAAALHTLAAAVGLAVLLLGAARFLALGNLLDLSLGIAFGVLATSNLMKLTILLFGSSLTAPLTTVLLLLARAVSTCLLAFGVFRSPVVVPIARRWRYGSAFVAAVAFGIGLGLALLVLFGGASTPPIDARAQQILDRGEDVQDMLSGQSPPLVLVDGLIALLVSAAAARSSWLSRRHIDPQTGWMAIALILFAFGFALDLPFPPVARDYVGFGDLFRMAAYVVLLISLAINLGRAAAERALGEERLRLSRELHDGLAQELSLMHFHLSEAIEAQEPMNMPALENLEEQVQRALLEARQAIGSLRAGLIDWEPFISAVETQCAEFEENHGLAVRLKQEGWGRLDVVLQTETLRILNEAFSNALRHGNATHVSVSIARVGDSLELRVEDDGAGLTAAKPSDWPGSGVGLASMRERVEHRGGSLSVGTAAAGGTVLSARIPIGQPVVR